MKPRLLVCFLLTALATGGAHAWVPVGKSDKPRLEVETRVMLWGVRFGPDLVGPGAPPRSGEFDDLLLRRGRLAARYRPLPWLEFFLQAGEDNLGAKAIGDNAAFKIKDLYTNLKVHDAFQVAAGQFKIPFLHGNLQSGFTQVLVDRSAVTAVRPAEEGSRDTGVMAWGNAGGFQYRVAALDGADQDGFGADSSLRGSGRLSWTWGDPDRGFSLTSASLGKSKRLQVGLQGDFQGDRADPLDASAPAALRDYGAWALDAYLDCPFGEGWALTVEGAWVQRHDAYEDPALATRDIDGYYTQAALLLPGELAGTRLQVAARLDDLDTRRGPARSSSTGKTFGISWLLQGHERKIQVDYTRRTEEPVNRDNDALRLSLVLVF